MTWYQWLFFIVFTYMTMHILIMWQTSKEEWEVMQSNVQVKQVVTWQP